MNKAKFKEIFDKCMATKRAWCPQVVLLEDGGSKDYSDWCEIDPAIVIRDFEIDTYDMQVSGVWDASNIDREFTRFEDAWAYFQSLDVCRVMDNAGRIYYDNLCGDSQ